MFKIKIKRKEIGAQDSSPNPEPKPTAQDQIRLAPSSTRIQRPTTRAHQVLDEMSPRQRPTLPDQHSAAIQFARTNSDQRPRTPCTPSVRQNASSAHLGHSRTSDQITRAHHLFDVMPPRPFPDKPRSRSTFLEHSSATTLRIRVRPVTDPLPLTRDPRDFQSDPTRPACYSNGR